MDRPQDNAAIPWRQAIGGRVRVALAGGGVAAVRQGMTLLVLWFVNIFCAGIITGTWVVTQVALIPARKQFPADSAARLHHVAEIGIKRFNPLCAVTSLLAGLLILTLRLSPSSASALFTAVGCAGTLGAVLISVLWNMPLNEKIANWSATAVPAEYPQFQKKWDRGNLARMALGLMSFASHVLSAL
jgi:hypothetical protein